MNAEKNVPPTKPEPPKAKTEFKSIPIKLTREEIEERSAKIIDALDSKERIQAEADQIKSQYKAKIEEQESKIVSLKTVLRAGFEYREKECRVAFRPKDRQKDFIRCDTGETVITEPMTAGDFQMDLLQQEAAKKQDAPVTQKDITVNVPTKDGKTIVVPLNVVGAAMDEMKRQKKSKE